MERIFINEKETVDVGFICACNSPKTSERTVKDVSNCDLGPCSGCTFSVATMTYENFNKLFQAAKKWYESDKLFHDTVKEVNGDGKH